MSRAEVSVREVGEEARPVWEAFVAGHEGATIYHGWPWRRIFGDAFGYRSWYLLAEDASGCAVGCLPLFLVASPLSRRLVSVPFRDRGGPLWQTPAAFAALVAEARRIRADSGARSVEFKSLVRYPPDLCQAAGLAERLYWVRSCVELRGFTRKAYLDRLGGKTRNMLRQAERASLEYEEVEDPALALRPWYELHLATQRGLGLPPFPERFFSRLIELLFPERAARLCVVRQGPRPIAAALLLLERRIAIYGYSASAPDVRDLRPNDYLLFNVICRLAAQGFESFDMGSDAPSQEGLLFFKRKWLATAATAPVYTLGEADPAVADSSNARYALARAVFQRLPLAALRMLGELTRFFG